MLLDQAISTLSNFGFLLAVNYILDDTELGTLIIGLTIADIAVGVTRISLGEVGYIDSDSNDLAQVLPVGMGTLLSVVSVPICAVLFLTGLNFWAVTVLMVPVIVAFDLVRYRLFRTERLGLATVMDLIWGVVSIGGAFAGAFWLDLTRLNLMLWYGLSGLAVAALAGGFERQVDFFEFARDLLSKRAKLGSGLSEFVLTSGVSFFYLLAPALFLGSTFTTPFRLAISGFGPINSVMLTPIALQLTRRWGYKNARMRELHAALAALSAMVSLLLLVYIVIGQRTGFGPIESQSFVVLSALLTTLGLTSRLSFTYARAQGRDGRFNRMRAGVWPVRCLVLVCVLWLGSDFALHGLIIILAIEILVVLLLTYAADKPAKTTPVQEQ